MQGLLPARWWRSRPLPASALSSAQTLNMSTDLVRLGIAARDLNPNDPTLDARPLFEAATDYVRAHPAVRVLTLTPGCHRFSLATRR